MFFEQLYVWHHTHFIYDILCTKHNVTSTLWVHTIVVTTLYPLHSWHHTHYIRHHTHDNTKVISAISPSISDTISTVCVPSNPVYKLYYSHSLYVITHYMYDITFSIHDITWTLYDITPMLVWHHIQYIYDNTLWHHTHIDMTSHSVYLWHLYISNIYDITYTVSWKQNDYTWHFTHCIWHHSHCICVVTPFYQCLHNNYGNFHTAHAWQHTHPTSHQIQTLWHQLSVFRTSQTLHSWHQISYIWYDIHGLWHLIPYTCDITATISVT